LATILAGFPGVLRNVYIGSLMKSVSAPAAGDTPLWIHITMGTLTIVASVLVTRYLYKYFKMAMGSEPILKPEESLEEDLECNNKTRLSSSTPPPTPPTPPLSESIVRVATPNPARQRIVPF